jgi:hypothetical protein
MNKKFALINHWVTSGILSTWLLKPPGVGQSNYNKVLGLIVIIIYAVKLDEVNPLSRNAPHCAILIFLFVNKCKMILLVNGEALQLNG